MTQAPNLRRWAAAAATSALLAAFILSRSACAPAQPPTAHTPAALPGKTATAPAIHGTPHANEARQSLPSPTPAPPGRLAPHSPFATSTVLPAPGVPTPSSPDPAPPLRGAVPPVQRNELSLLASIERELKREPPAQVHQLLALYRGGADRTQLIDSVQRDFPKDLPLRVTVLRWIDEVRPQPGRKQATPPLTGKRADGAGWVRPLKR